jgi:hypothetical protein
MTRLLVWIDKVFDVSFWLMRPLPPLVVLAVFSLLTAVASLLVLRWISNQKELRRAKDLIGARILEVRLFSDQPRVVTRAYVSLIGDTVLYLRYALAPLLVLAVPFLLLFGQLDTRFGHTPLQPGRDFLLSATFRTPDSLATAALKLPPEIVEVAPPVHIPFAREIDWELLGQRPGIYNVGLLVQGSTVSNRVVIGTGLTRLAAERTRGRFWPRIADPGESPLPLESTVDHIGIQYPLRLYGLGSWQAGWLLPYVIMIVADVLLLKKCLRVEI